MTQKLLWLISAWKFLVCRSESEGCQGNYSKIWKGRKNCESYIFKNIPGINFIFSNWKFFSCFFRLCFFCVFYFPFSFLTIIRTTNLVDTNRKLTVHKTFRRHPARLLSVLYTFSLRPVSTGKQQSTHNMSKFWKYNSFLASVTIKLAAQANNLEKR